MGLLLLDLFLVASQPVLKVLMITLIGSFLAFDHVDVLGENARKHLNNVVFFVFNPALVSSNLAQTITFDNFVKLWFMPFNMLMTFVVGSAAGWILVKVTKAPQHLKGLILGACAAGNMGNLPLIIIPAICKEKRSPFGAPDICLSYGLAYASLSMAIGAIFLWSFVYNIVRISSTTQNPTKTCTEQPLLLYQDRCSTNQDDLFTSSSSSSSYKLLYYVIKRHLVTFSEKINLKALLAPSTTGAMVGFFIGMIPQLRTSLIGSSAPLRVVQDSASMLGDAAIPSVTLIVGGNLLKGLKGSAGIQPGIVVGIIAVRYIFLPLLGIFFVKSAIHLGLVHSDPLYQFVLLLQFAVPPAMNIGTITQLFGGQNECSVIMLWAYGLASVSLTLWSTFFMWLVS
ncbi:hypothetical protein Dimus_017457 [Dionaea muscipula]